MKPKSAKILDGIRKLIETVQVFLYPEAAIPWIQFQMSTGATPELYKMVCNKEWETIELKEDTVLQDYLDLKETWYEIVSKLLEEGKTDIWIDRVYAYEFTATNEFYPTLVIVPKRK